MEIWHYYLTHWGRVTHIYISKLTIIGSDNGVLPDRRQAIIWTNAGSLSIGPLRTYFSENLIKTQQFSLKKVHVKMSSAKWCPSCLGLNVLTYNKYIIVRFDGDRQKDSRISMIRFMWIENKTEDNHILLKLSLCCERNFTSMNPNTINVNPIIPLRAKGNQICLSAQATV